MIKKIASGLLVAGFTFHANASTSEKVDARERVDAIACEVLMWDRGEEPKKFTTLTSIMIDGRNPVATKVLNYGRPRLGDRITLFLGVPFIPTVFPANTYTTKYNSPYSPTKLYYLTNAGAFDPVEPAYISGEIDLTDLLKSMNTPNTTPVKKKSDSFYGPFSDNAFIECTALFTRKDLFEYVNKMGTDRTPKERQRNGAF